MPTGFDRWKAFERLEISLDEFQERWSEPEKERLLRQACRLLDAVAEGLTAAEKVHKALDRLEAEASKTLSIKNLPKNADTAARKFLSALSEWRSWASRVRFIDTDYNGESFFVRHAYFLGQNDPYKALKTTLKAEIDADATWNSDTSQPFDAPSTGRIAVKVINHLGDEVMKVFRVS